MDDSVRTIIRFSSAKTRSHLAIIEIWIDFMCVPNTKAPLESNRFVSHSQEMPRIKINSISIVLVWPRTSVADCLSRVEWISHETIRNGGERKKVENCIRLHLYPKKNKKLISPKWFCWHTAIRFTLSQSTVFIWKICFSLSLSLGPLEPHRNVQRRQKKKKNNISYAFCCCDFQISKWKNQIKSDRCILPTERRRIRISEYYCCNCYGEHTQIELHTKLFSVKFPIHVVRLWWPDCIHTHTRTRCPLRCGYGTEKQHINGRMCTVHFASECQCNDRYRRV